MRKNVFEIVGYSVDYYVDGKFKGSRNIDNPDRSVFGYHGRKTRELKWDVVLKNKRVIKAGTTVVTELNQINGKVLNKPAHLRANKKEE